MLGEHKAQRRHWLDERGENSCPSFSLESSPHFACVVVRVSTQPLCNSDNSTAGSDDLCTQQIEQWPQPLHPPGQSDTQRTLALVLATTTRAINTHNSHTHATAERRFPSMHSDSDNGEGPSTRRRGISQVSDADGPPHKRYCASSAHDSAGSPRPRLRLRFSFVPPLTPTEQCAGLHSGDGLGRPPATRCLVGGGKPRRRAQRRAGSDEDFESQAQPRPRAPRTQRRTRSRRQSATPTTLESIAHESAAIRAEVARLGLALRDVTADGNCLFRALGDQLWGEQGRHGEVRQLVCDHLASAKDELGDFVAGFLNEGETYDRYVERMRGPGVYGSHIELLAASKVFRRSIRIILSQTSYTVEFDGPNNVLNEAWNNAVNETAGPTTRRRARASTIDSPPQPGHGMLWLALFSEAEHYESVRRVGPGAGTGPAEVPDALAVPHERDVSEAARSQRANSGDAPQSKRSSLAERYIADGRVAQVIASLPPWHGISDDDAASVLVRCDGDVSRAIDILFDQLDSDGDGDAATEASDTSADVDADAKVVDAMLYRTSSGSSASSAVSGSTAATSVMSAGSVKSTASTNPSPPPTPSTAPVSPASQDEHAPKPTPPRITRSQARKNKRLTRSSKM